MKRLFVLLLFSLLSFSAISQDDAYLEVKSALSKQYKKVIFNDDQIPWFAIYKNGKVGICNIYGEIIIPPTRYTAIIQHFENDCLYYSVQFGKHEGICDSKGNEIISPIKYTKINPIFQNGLWYYSVQDGDKIGICDMNGIEIVSPGLYSSIDIFRTQDHCFLYVKSNDKQGIIDMTGKLIIAPDKYSEINLKDKFGIWFYFEVKREDCYGICNLDGEEVVPTSYKYVKSNNKGTGFKVSNTLGPFVDYLPEKEFIGPGYELCSNNRHNYFFDISNYTLPSSLSHSPYHSKKYANGETTSDSCADKSSTARRSNVSSSSTGMTEYNNSWNTPGSPEYNFNFHFEPFQPSANNVYEIQFEPFQPSANNVIDIQSESYEPASANTQPFTEMQYRDFYREGEEFVSDGINQLSLIGNDSYAASSSIKMALRDKQRNMMNLRLEAAKYGIIIEQSPMETIKF